MTSDALLGNEEHFTNETLPVQIEENCRLEQGIVSSELLVRVKGICFLREIGNLPLLCSAKRNQSRSQYVSKSQEIVYLKNRNDNGRHYRSIVKFLVGNTTLDSLTLVSFAVAHNRVTDCSEEVVVSKRLHRKVTMRATSVRLWNTWTVLVPALCCFLGSATQVKAQLWDVPPLPPVKYAPAPDGMTATVGNESIHFSVCRSSVIHFVATPEPPDTVKQNQPWMLGAKESCPGAGATQRT